MSFCFNPRTPAGCYFLVASETSIMIGFNPRTPAGCDVKTAYCTLTRLMFQSTHPCGVRQFYPVTGAIVSKVSIHAPLRGATSNSRLKRRHLWSFNPRTPAGCDSHLLRSWKALNSFNPRTPAGCDLFCLALLYHGLHCFNPRTPAGCD